MHKHTDSSISAYINTKMYIYIENIHTCNYMDTYIHQYINMFI